MNKSQTNFERLEQMTDSDIDLSDIPALSDEMMARGVVRDGIGSGGKIRIVVHVDEEISDWFGEQGVDYQDWFNGVLRSSIDAPNITTSPQVIEAMGRLRHFSTDDRLTLASLLLNSLLTDETTIHSEVDKGRQPSYIFNKSRHELPRVPATGGD